MDNSLNINLRKLYGQLFEMEGLVQLALTRDDIPAEVYASLREKAREVMRLSELVNPEAVEEAEEPQAAPIREIPVIEGAEDEEVTLFDFPADLIDATNPFEPIPAAGETQADQPTDPVTAADQAVAESAEAEEEADAEGQAAPEVEDHAPVGIDEPREDENDEPLFPESSTDRLKRMFTINDRYRFRRELFSNNDSDMADAVNLFSAMRSYDEAEDYIVNDLGWDREVPEVIDFMKILDSFFNQR